MSVMMMAMMVMAMIVIMTALCQPPPPHKHTHTHTHHYQCTHLTHYCYLMPPPVYIFSNGVLPFFCTTLPFSLFLYLLFCLWEALCDEGV